MIYRKGAPGNPPEDANPIRGEHVSSEKIVLLYDGAFEVVGSDLTTVATRKGRKNYPGQYDDYPEIVDATSSSP
jgi:hypothetical protein